MATTVQNRSRVALSLRHSPIIGVVRTSSREEAAVQARMLAAAGVELVEITFTVPGASGLLRELLAGRASDGPPFFGMGTATTAARAREAERRAPSSWSPPTSTPRWRRRRGGPACSWSWAP